MAWSEAAEEAVKEIPFLVRPLIRRRIESLAKEAGLEEVSLSFYEEARARFGRR
ncbi:MAG: PCP reductase family protein [Synechococcaceae cyanobacterium]|nr:PCP reductase family protein [Synechococcaceae cyanobacterium]